MAAFIDNCGFIPTAGGTTDWVYSSTVGGYQSPAAASAVSGETYVFRAQSADLTQWEIAQGTYNSGTGTFARTTVLYNSLGTTAKVSFTVAPALVAIVPVAKDVARTLRTRTIITSGSGTYTTPTGCRAINVRLVGGGGGGGMGNANTATAGGNTTFSTLTASGGGAGWQTGGTGGGSSGGDVNLQGGGGQGGSGVFSGTNNLAGGSGGNSAFGGGGVGSYNAAGQSGAAGTGGGGGGGGITNSNGVPGGGGGAGGYLEKLVVNPASTYGYAVGTGGTGGPASGVYSAGGSGASGIIIIDEQY